ncbi:MAG: sulfotransferase [Marinibacterium sp.]
MTFRSRRNSRHSSPEFATICSKKVLGDFTNKDTAIAAYRENNRKVRQQGPARSLLVIDGSAGPEPLCHFLEVDEPEFRFRTMLSARHSGGISGRGGAGRTRNRLVRVHRERAVVHGIRGRPPSPARIRPPGRPRCRRARPGRFQRLARRHNIHQGPGGCSFRRRNRPAKHSE